MSRLVALGCSHVFGHGLPDCYIPEDKGPGPNPSEMGWVSYLGKHYELEVVNLGICGGSIKNVAYRVSTFDFKPSDKVFILYPFFGRWSLINQEGERIITPNAPDIFSDNFYKYFYDPEDALFMASVFIGYINSTLKSKGVTAIHSFVQDIREKISFEERGIIFPDLFYKDYLDIYNYPPTPCWHLGIEGQKAFAEDVIYLLEHGEIPPKRRTYKQ